MSNFKFKISRQESLYLVNNLVKHYPNKMRYFEYDEPFLKRIEGLEPMEKKEVDTNYPPNPENALQNRIRSLRRTKTVITDLILMNNFTHFGTLNFSPKKVDRYDDNAVKAKLNNFLTVVQRKGKFEYLIVPERHKDGALHYHLLMKDYPCEMIYSGRKPYGRKVYNLPEYKAGFSNITEIADLARTANYIKKYITKELLDEPAKNRYYRSKNLIMPKISYNQDIHQLKTENNGKFDLTSVYSTNFYSVIDIVTSKPATPPIKGKS